MENAIIHLERSNEELRAAIKEDPDPEYQNALYENVDVLGGMIHKVNDINKELETLKPSTTFKPKQSEPAKSEDGGAWL